MAVFMSVNVSPDAPQE